MSAAFLLWVQLLAVGTIGTLCFSPRSTCFFFNGVHGKSPWGRAPKS